MARPTSAELHRARRARETEWRDWVLQLVDHTLSEALKALDTAEVVRKADPMSQRVHKLIKRGQLRVHVARLTLREFFDDPSPD